MVASKQRDLLRCKTFQCEQHNRALKPEVASVYVVTEEEEGRCRTLDLTEGDELLKEVVQVVEVAVDVTKDVEGGAKAHQHAFLPEQAFRVFAHLLHLMG